MIFLVAFACSFVSLYSYFVPKIRINIQCDVSMCHILYFFLVSSKAPVHILHLHKHLHGPHHNKPLAIKQIISIVASPLHPIKKIIIQSLFASESGNPA